MSVYFFFFALFFFSGSKFNNHAYIECIPKKPLGSSVPISHPLTLRRRCSIKGSRAIDGLLPRKPILDVKLGRNLEVTVALQKDGAHDNFVGAHDGLVVVGVRGAVGAVVAVHCVSCGKEGVRLKEEEKKLGGGLPESP